MRQLWYKNTLIATAELVVISVAIKITPAALSILVHIQRKELTQSRFAQVLDNDGWDQKDLLNHGVCIDQN